MAIDLEQAPKAQSDVPGVIYPESDGNPISDHTLQFEWIVTIKGNLDSLFADDPNVFVAGDLLWYPVKGSPKVRLAPDVMVVFGRPKGERGSYQQFNEEGIAPQVVFEVLSPGNRAGEMISKFVFYQKYGVEEYYLYDPFKQDFSGWVRPDGGFELERVDTSDAFLSPRLGVSFVVRDEMPLEIYQPNGDRFLTFIELAQRAEAERQRAAAAEQRAVTAEQRALSAEQRAEQLAAKLRTLGINPETVS
jgi:Uma2 family endonuclease